MAVERCPRDAKFEQATFRPARIFMHEKEGGERIKAVHFWYSNIKALDLE